MADFIIELSKNWKWHAIVIDKISFNESEEGEYYVILFLK